MRSEFYRFHSVNFFLGFGETSFTKFFMMVEKYYENGGKSMEFHKKFFIKLIKKTLESCSNAPIHC